MGATSRMKTPRCVGDPYGVAGEDCLAPATAFVFGAIPGEFSEPLVVAVPTCEAHGPLVFDWVSEQSPFRSDVVAFPWEYFDAFAAKVAEIGEELWLYTDVSAVA